MLCSACTEQQDSSASNVTRKFKPEEMRQSPESFVKKSSSYPNVLLEESTGERCKVDSAVQYKSMKSGSGCESKCKETLSISKMLCSACTRKQDSSVSNENKKFTSEIMRLSPKSDVELNFFLSNIRLEESPEESHQVDSAGQSDVEEKPDGTRSRLLSMKSGLVCDNKCKEALSISPPPDACSGKEPDLISLKTSDGISCSHQAKGKSVLGTLTLEGTDKLNKDQYSGLCDNLGMKRKSTSTLITFSRRSKRNGNIAAAAPKIASESEIPPPASCPVDMKNEDAKLMDCNTEKVCYLFCVDINFPFSCLHI